MLDLVEVALGRGWLLLGGPARGGRVPQNIKSVALGQLKQFNYHLFILGK